jgi:hypothetical protein
MRRIAPLFAATALLVGLIAPSAGARPRVVKGGFTATATPFPNPHETVPGMYGCASGTEGQHKVSHPFTAPFAGWFRATLTFDGDWDLYLTDATGDPIAESYTYKPRLYGLTGPERLEHFLHTGQEVVIVACNWAGSTEAEARYVHRAARAWPGPPTGEVTHEDLLFYTAPAVATTENMATCWEAVYGCFTLIAWANDRSVRIKVEDLQSPSVAFTVIQFHKNTYIHGDNYCGSTHGPIEIHPGVDRLSVGILLGACEGGSTPYVPTTGTIRAEFRG